MYIYIDRQYANFTTVSSFRMQIPSTSTLSSLSSDRNVITSKLCSFLIDKMIAPNVQFVEKSLTLAIIYTLVHCFCMEASSVCFHQQWTIVQCLYQYIWQQFIIHSFVLFNLQTNIYLTNRGCYVFFSIIPRTCQERIWRTRIYVYQEHVGGGRAF